MHAPVAQDPLPAVARRLALVAGCRRRRLRRRRRAARAADPEVRSRPGARGRAGAGEIVIRGELSPASHGPYEFDGRYVVAFEQTAPEDPDLDFSRQTSFVATLDTEAEIERRDSIKLFQASRRTGRKRIELHGRYYVDVSFGDFPYAIRFTPNN